MKKIFIQYKPFFTFLIKFVLFYFVFAFIYNQFLNQFDVSKFELDSITKMVSNHTSYFMHLFDEDCNVIPNKNEASMKVIYNGKYIARVIEGCNAISVIILFAAFIFAFASNWVKTFLYIIIGSLLIYVLNIVRIGLLVWAIYYYPDYQEFLHGTVFPLFIYGVVFILWIIWVTKFSKYAK
ncbi:exosortase family protein XrtF [Flavobacterium ponti]|uniref:Exosortase family protein XrtF n=1 Tax=Flavobacterium ponti TaxID=665133 RepID=A0ABV9P070_9FLAO